MAACAAAASDRRPVAGVDYPRTLVEFLDWFPDEGSCWSYLVRLRWPEGFRCHAAAAATHTDGLNSYQGLSNLGYTHVVSSISASDPAHVVMPAVHRVASLLKRWLLGTHQGGVAEQHLDAYLDEFVFRFNRRTSLKRGLLFYRLLELAVRARPTTYETGAVSATRAR